MLFYASALFADQAPVFEEIEKPETVISCAAPPFVGSDDEHKCTDGSCQTSIPAEEPIFEKDEEALSPKASFTTWSRYKANFGMEKLLIRFPQKPAVSQSNTLLTAYAYDQAIMYSVTGYYPPIGNVDFDIWFEEILYNVSSHPYTLVNHSIYPVDGDWVLDYVAHDYIQNLVLKVRSVVTPFNAYTVQCVKPQGARDNFDYFLDNFWIQCDCDH